MASKTLSSIVGGGGLPQLAPDLTWPSRRVSSSTLTEQVLAIDVSGVVLQEVLNKNGKFFLEALFFDSLSAGVVSVKLTIDGVIIFNDSYTSSTADVLVDNDSPSERFEVKSNITLEYATAVDTNITLNYVLRAAK